MREVDGREMKNEMGRDEDTGEKRDYGEIRGKD